MDKKTLVDLIQNNVIEIETLISSLKKSYNIPDIEIKLVKSKLQVLLDEIEILGNLNENNDHNFKTDKPVENKYEVVHNSEKPEYEIITNKTDSGIAEDTKPDKGKNDKPSHTEEKKAVIENESVDIKKDSKITNLSQHSSKSITENKAAVIKNKEKVVKQKPDNLKNSIVADSFEVNRQSLYDIISESKRTKDLASKFKDNPISDLKKAISINDKMRYINELFGASSNQYNTTIDKLNTCSNLEEALKYLNENYTWDQNKQSFRDFLELIYRKFINA